MRVIITPKAAKQFERLPKSEKTKIQKKLTMLEEDVLAGKKLSGSYSELRSLKAWPYRVIYYVDGKQKTIYIVTIAHRQGVYS